MRIRPGTWRSHTVPLRLWGYSTDVCSRAALDHVSTDLKGVAMEAGAMALMGLAPDPSIAGNPGTKKGR
jgi:hypothetical protein